MRGRASARKVATWLGGAAAIVILAIGLGGQVGCSSDEQDGDGDGDRPTRDHAIETGIPPVDIVVLVDNSGSMAQEQAALAAAFPGLIAELVDPSDSDGDTEPDHPAVEDLNIGVVSTDMGTGGYRVATCSNSAVGDDGCFRNAPSPLVSGCGTSYPLFLSRDETNAASYSAADMAQDFACIATLGTNGCGFEQQLKAMRKAVTVNTGPGGCNQGFLRPTSVLVLIFVTDEEDCSVAEDHPEMFDPELADLGHLSLRCFLHAELVDPVDDYVEAFRGLRTDHPERLVVGMIVGVPPDAGVCIGAGDTLDDCLDHPLMTEVIDPAAPTMLRPSCRTTMGLALPPRRLVALARSFGDRAWVDSICKTDWTDAMRGIAARTVVTLGHVCLGEPLSFLPDGCKVDCGLLERLPDDRPCREDPACPAAACPPAAVDDLFRLDACTDRGTGIPCRPLWRDLGLDADGRRVCLVRQALRSFDGFVCGATLEDGWYYLQAAHGPAGCPQLVFVPGSETLVEADADVVLRCR